MPEDENVSHLMKGIAEDFYQALLTKEVKMMTDFLKSCLHIEEMKERRINRIRFDRLPYAIPMSSLTEETDLVTLIRQVVRKEIQRVMAPNNDNPAPQIQSFEAITRDKVKEALAPLTRAEESWTEIRPRP